MSASISISCRNRQKHSTTASYRVFKVVSFLSIILVQLDLGISFSLPPPTRLVPTSATTSLLDTYAYGCRNAIGKSNHRRSLLTTKMANADDAKLVEQDNKVQNWFFGFVIPLQLVYASNQLTRSSIYYLVDFSSDATTGATADPFRAMNVAIGFSEAQYGLLASLAFTALFAIASLGAGAAADKYDRKTLTVGAAVGWSVAIIGTALSTTYTEVLSWRIIMGLFCAFTTPTAYTLISEKVPKDRLSLATSIYGTGVAFGGASASLTILVDNQIGWSQTLLAIGVVGIICAVLAALVLPSDNSKSSTSGTDVTIDVTSADADTENEYSFLDGVSESLATTRAKWIYGGSFLRFCSGLCIGVWSAPFFREAFPDNASDYAVAQAFITAVASTASGLVGGAAADYLSSTVEKSANDDNKEDNADLDVTGIRLWIPVVGSLLAAPTWYLAVHSTDSFQTAMVWLTVEYLVAECWFGPTISTLLSTVPSKVGGTAQGMFTLTGAIANLSPTFLGYLYGQASLSAASADTVEMSQSELLPVLLTTGVCFGYISCAFCFVMGARSPPPAVTIKSKSN
mmetsp:Transcript_9610/g.20812  ORF Transcript_9610/g.20812 Transcript_9610/m.20812 type:complete len:571 (-) Transcript_9610:1693-3405(-)|eukprot:CAMPEP_0168163908 /NCGR_PEP_ID=MMETSP0139_2-20121125/637_1 /TAXON_ID=44445 /ORGANISM="Pseudo-nitzschia australis, Strain 10249 10 AB" /LENGTH=570 /DNA_ID=CAMNT_0008080855 /DNA_START=255 /DNA_END=1967 /DNA_ORIENTATION=-